MPRLQVYLPGDLYNELKRRGLPASELLQEAVRAELERTVALEAMDEYVAELSDEVGGPAPDEAARAHQIARRTRSRILHRTGWTCWSLTAAASRASRNARPAPWH